MGDRFQDDQLASTEGSLGGGGRLHSTFNTRQASQGNPQTVDSVHLRSRLSGQVQPCSADTRRGVLGAAESGARFATPRAKGGQGPARV